MSFSPAELANKRKAALDRLRERRGSQRIWRGNDDGKTSKEFLAKYYEPFVRRKESPDSPGEAGGRPSTAEIKDFIASARKLLREQGTKAEDAPAEGERTGFGAGWSSLIERTGAENFAQNFFRWLGAVPLEHGLSSTPIDELECIRKEAGFRRLALEAMLKITESECEAVDTEIRARKTLANGIE
jgi:hypothetical protein